MSFFLGFPLSSETNIAILALSGETTWFKEQVKLVIAFAGIPVLSFISFIPALEQKLKTYYNFAPLMV